MTDIIPGLKGFGTDTRAAYGALNDPVIFIVTNLGTTNGTPGNSTRNGTSVKTGSFLEAVNYNPPADTGKIILFEVSGTINAVSEPYQYNVDNPYTTIYGQTAPSPGITLRNIYLTLKRHDIFAQHFRVRVGDNPNGVFPGYRDALAVTATGTHILYKIVLDHISASNALDEILQIYNNSSSADLTDVTVCNCFITEPLNNSLHPEGEHGKSFFSGTWISNPISRISHFNNLLAHGKDRTPKISDVDDLIWANNLTYNSEWFGAIWGSYWGAGATNMTNNVFIGGVNSGIYATDFFVTFFESGLYNGGVGSSLYLTGNRVGEFVAGSVVWNEIQANSNDWDGVDNRDSVATPFKTTTENVTIPGAVFRPSDEVAAWVLAHSGCRPADRDSIDTRIVNEVQTGTGQIKDCMEAGTIYYPTGTALGGSSNTIIFEAQDIDGRDDRWNGKTIEIIAGRGSGQSRTINNWVKSTRTARVSVNWNTNPDDTSEYRVLNTCTNSVGGWPVLPENVCTLDIPSNPHDYNGEYTNLELWAQGLADIVEGGSTPPPPPVVQDRPGMMTMMMMRGM